MIDKSKAILVHCSDKGESPTREVAEGFIGGECRMVQLEDGRQLVIEKKQDMNKPINEEVFVMYNEDDTWPMALSFFGNAFLLTGEARWKNNETN